MDKIVYVCDIDNDIDDMIAVHYLHLKNKLSCVVLDRPTTSSRVDELKSFGVLFKDNIPEGTTHIFCGGALTHISEYLDNNKLELLVCNGGFAGSNIVDSKDELDKFKGKTHIRTYNFNCDVNSTIKVLMSPNIMEILLVSKNVCHSSLNTFGKTSQHIHHDNFLMGYNLSPEKRLHDLLMVKEGLSYIFGDTMLCEYKPVTCVNKLDKPYANSNNSYSLWGCILNEQSNTKISVKIK